MIENRLSWRTGEPVLTVKVHGFYDVYRFSRHLTMGQVEFGAVGQKVIASLRRHSSREGWARFIDYLHGTGGRNA